LVLVQDHSLSAWARDATFGIFIHWGAYSVPAWAEPTGAWGAVPPEDWFAHNAYAEWYANTIRIEGSPAAQHHLAEFGGIPYVELLDIWRADSFDPVDWARLFRSAGADYVVPVTKHHDGIALWDAPGAGDMSTIERGPRRDLIGPLAEAVRGEGLRFGVYYSGGLDWHVTDHPPLTSMAHVEDFRPVDAAYSEYATSHVRDLIERYEPCVVWNDINWPDAGQHDGTLDDLRAYYRSVVPDGIVNDRWGRMDLADYRTSEYAFDATNELGSGWEHCRGLGYSFGYNRVEDASLTLSPRELAKVYADVVSRGGRLLLNVGPDAYGRIPEVQRRTLEGIATWMQAVKPLTADRRVLAADEVTVRGAEDGLWWRGWWHHQQLVIISNDADIDVAVGNAEEVTILELPGDDA